MGEGRTDRGRAEAPRQDAVLRPARRRQDDAKLAVQRALDAASAVSIEREGRDRYARTLARVYLDGADLSAALIRHGLGRAYEGGRRQGWCR